MNSIKRVLVVEESKLFANLIAKEISSRDNLEPIIVHSLGEILKEIEKDSFFVAIVDVGLADSSKLEILDLLTKNKISSIVLIASENEKIKKNLENYNIIDYVIKKSASDILHGIYLIDRLIRNSHSKILVVDDSKLFRTVVKETLNRHFFQTLEAEDGKVALSVLEKNSDVKLVLTDYHMPIMDGFEFTKSVRKIYSREQLGIMVISSAQDPDAPTKFIKNGANDFISKPFTNEEFFARVYLNIENIELIKESKKLNKTLKEINDYNVVEQLKAHQKQLNIITNDLLTDTEFTTDVIYKPSDILSGDSYSIYKRGDGSIFIFLIDGQGHGILPSLTSFSTSAAIKQRVDYADNLDSLITRVLESLHGVLDEDEQLSYTLLHLSKNRDYIEYAIGGMYPSYILCNNEINQLKANNLPIMSFTQSLKIDKLDIEEFRSLMLYSDGLTEEEHNSFGNKKLTDLLLEPELFKKLDKELKDKKTEDDTTLIVMRKL